MSGMMLAQAGSGKVRTQPAFQAAGTIATAGGTSTINVPYPAGIAAGQLLIVHIKEQDSATVNLTVPSGWTLVGSGATIPGNTVGSDAIYKVANGTESGNLTINGQWDTNAIARMYSFSSGVGVQGFNSSAAAAGSTTVSMLAVTTTGTLELAVSLIFGQANTTVGASTGETGGDWTEAVAEAAGATYCMQIQTATMASPGTITGGTTTFGASAINRMVLAFAIVP